MQAEEDSGFTARGVTDMNLFLLDVIQDYALAVARDILTNGLACLLKDWKETYSIGILSLEFLKCFGNIFKKTGSCTRF